MALEAAATGIPLVTSNVGGLGEAVITARPVVLPAPRYYRTGHCGPRRLDDPDAAQRMAIAARERLTSAFDWHTVADETAQVYLAAKRADANRIDAAHRRHALPDR